MLLQPHFVALFEMIECLLFICIMGMCFSWGCCFVCLPTVVFPVWRSFLDCPIDRSSPGFRLRVPDCFPNSIHWTVHLFFCFRTDGLIVPAVPVWLLALSCVRTLQSPTSQVIHKLPGRTKQAQTQTQRACRHGPGLEHPAG